MRACLRGLAALLLAAVPLFAWSAEPAASAASGPTHKPLRQNRSAVPPPTDPLVFNGYADAPAFTVVPRKTQLTTPYPCSMCHKVLPLNTTPRKLVNAPHPAALDHGKGRFWCLDCHQGNDRDVLHLANGTKVDFDESYRLCGQCHGPRERDWAFGAHGKRVAGWTGERQLYACTHCHDPHNPTIAPRSPSKPPPVRAGLQRTASEGKSHEQ